MPIDLSPLRDRFGGVLTTPKDPAYESVRVLFNTRIRTRPAVLAGARTPRTWSRPSGSPGRSECRSRPQRRAPRLRVLPGRGRPRVDIGGLRGVAFDPAPARAVGRRGRRVGD